MNNESNLSLSSDKSYVIVPAVRSDDVQVTNSDTHIRDLLASLSTAFQALSTQERIEMEQKIATLAMEITSIGREPSSNDSPINPVYVAIAEQMMGSESISSTYSDCSSGNRVNSLYVAIATLMLKSEPDNLAQFINRIRISEDNISRNNSSNSLSTISDDIVNIDAISNTEFSAQTVISGIAEPTAVEENTTTDEVTHNFMEESILMLTRFTPDYSHIATFGVVALALLISAGIAMLLVMPVPVSMPTNIETPPVVPFQKPVVQAPRNHGIFAPTMEHAQLRAVGQRDMMEREVRMQQANFDLRQQQQRMQLDIDALNARNMDWIRR